MLDIHPTGWRKPVAVLALGAFAVGTDGFVIAGVLPDIADSLNVTVGAAGQLVTVFAIAYAVLAPLLGTVTASWSRRSALIAALLTVAVGNAITALAPTFGLVLASRVLAAAGASLFTATASATAAGLAGDKYRGRAIANVVLGTTLALALGAPLGTAVATALGWRATLWTVAVLALVAIPALTIWLPAVRPSDVPGLRARLQPLRDGRVLVLLIATVSAFVGIYMPYTYISAVYAEEGGRLALLLLVFGIGGTVGNLLAGHLADRYGPRSVLLTVLVALTAVFCVLPALRGPIGLAVVAVAISSPLSFMVTTPQQHQLLALAPAGGQALITSLYQSAAYLAVSLSGAVGGVELTWFGPGWLAPIAAAFTATAAVITWTGTRQPSDPAGETSTVNSPQGFTDEAGQ